MQTIDGQLLYSATDLVGFLACTHLTNLDRASVAGLLQRPMYSDPEMERIVKRGFQHEARFRDELVSQGLTVTEILPDASIADPGDKLRLAVERTHEAMRRGDDVIYQAALSDGRRRGHPDFLRKVETPSDLGDWSYEVWDTKLARHAKGSAVLQVCLYSDLLHIAQGLKPENMYLALGGREQAKVKLRYDDYAAYYRLVSSDFEKQVYGSAVAVYPPPSRPDPVEHCDVCKWSELCRKELRRTDDLSLVAGITANQRRQLRERKVPTRSALAKLDLPMDPPLKGNAQSLKRVREQARIQVQGQAQKSVISELLEASKTREGEWEARGLLSLPAPSPGDLFFDIEGDPFALEDGVDYLFGVIEPRLLDDKGEPVFHSFWSIDADNEVTPDAERKAFEAFIDLVMDRLALNPDLHVYHYAPYEPTAVKRLMGRYGTREDEVDRLLRSGVFVDLFHAARQGIRASVESYSIKKLEPLYGFDRVIDLRDAGSSIAAFETWLELGGDAVKDDGLLDHIRDYNKDDCVSTWLLRNWLEAQRDALAVQMKLDLPRPQPRDDQPSQQTREEIALTQAVSERLTAGVSDDVHERSPEEQGRWLLAQLLSWHRREDKSTWWRYYYLIEVLTDEDRITEPDAMGGLTFVGRLRQEARSYVYRFAFPAQEFKIGVGDKPHDPQTRTPAGTVVEIDEAAGFIDIKRSTTLPPPEATSLVPLQHVDAKPMRDGLLRLGQWVAENGIDAAGPNAVGRELLLRHPPRFRAQALGTGLILEGETPDLAARRLVTRLDSSYLAIQGPPGSGKTSVGAEMIVDLVVAGKRVGVTAGSHKVVGHLLQEANKAAERRGITLRLGQRAAIDEDGAYDGATRLLTSEKARDALLAGELDVLGATTWLWAREDMQESVDVLFVDEAGQMSLANVVAAASGARNIVLLGDPQQLDQPLKGVHPPGADKSALAHILGDHPTMPPDMGLFLDGTWRLHPDVCAYTSEVFYEGRLSSRPGRDVQDVAGAGVLSGTGIRFVPVNHVGHASDSDEEAAALDGLLKELFAQESTWTNDKGETKALTMKDVLVVTPYNAQVRTISELIPGVQVGTVDKFQGQEGAIAIYSMATSSAEEAPRGMEFLYSLNRLNVATSRARCLAVVIASPDLVRVRCRTPRQMRLANALARLVEMTQQGTVRPSPVSV